MPTISPFSIAWKGQIFWTGRQPQPSLTRPAFFDILSLQYCSKRENSFSFKYLWSAQTDRKPSVSGYLSLFLHALAQVLNIALTMYMWIIIVRALLSWVNPDPYNPIVQFLHSITEPVLYRVRKAIPMPGMGLDLSPILIILAIIFLQTFLVGSLEHASVSLSQR
jgi:YggT family protein